MRIATYILLFAITLWCLAVTAYALFVTFGAMATIATIAVPILCTAIFNTLQDLKHEALYAPLKPLPILTTEDIES